jgi:RNA polymerase sigma factor (sigma-70 family)
MSMTPPRTEIPGSSAASGIVLGDVLDIASSTPCPPERDWALLIQLTAAGDQRAFRELYERAHPLVFTLIARLTNSRATADELTVEVFCEIWKMASNYEPACGSVIAWIMRLARSSALERLRREQAFDADVLTPTTPLWGEVAKRVLMDHGLRLDAAVPVHGEESPWREVGGGIECKLLAIEGQHDRVSMLVRLAPGAEYPAHTHADTEELHLLDGELAIDDRKLYPGDYNRAEAGSSDARVASETGCTCVLVTSLRDLLR